MVPRYMKFSQQSTNNLQTTLRTLTTHHTATLTPLTTHTRSLTHTLQSLQSHNTRLLASLNDIGSELLKESFGRRREVKVRIRLVRREERVLEGLRRWLRSSEERVGRVNDDGDDEARTWLNEMVQDAKILVDELDSPLHLTLPHPDDDLEDGGTIETPPTPVVISGSLARLITIQSTINELVDELQQEQSRRIRAEEALVRYEIHQEVLQKDDDDDDDEKEGTDLPLPSPLLPPLPPKNSSLVPTESDNHVGPSSSPAHHPLPLLPPPPSRTRPLSDTQPELEPSEPGVLAHIPTIISPSEQAETTKTEGDMKIIPTPSQFNLPPSHSLPPLSLPPDDDNLSEQTTTATAPVIRSERTPTLTNIIEDGNERRSFLEVPPPPPPVIAVTATTEEGGGVTTTTTMTSSSSSSSSSSPGSNRTVDVLLANSGDSRVNGVVVEEERIQAGVLEEEGEGESMENEVERDSSSITSPPSVVQEETDGSSTRTTLTWSLPEMPLRVLSLSSDDTVVDDSSQEEEEMEMATNTTTTAMTHANGDSIMPEAVDTVVREEPPPETNQTQQHYQPHGALDSELDLLESSQQPPPPLPPTIEHSVRENTQDLEVPEAPEVSLAEDSTRDVLCTLEPPIIIVEPIPIPITGAYTGTLNGVVAGPTTHSGSGRAVTTQHDGLISNPSLELDAVVAPVSSSSTSLSSLPIVPSPPPPPPSVPISLSPPLPPPPPPPQHPLLQHLQKARTRYDHIQRAFHDCHIALESLKSSFLHPTTTQYPRTHAVVIPQKGSKDEWFKAIIQRLDDHTEDVRVELEIRISDEEVLGRGYEALLSVPGALGSHDHHQDDGGETLAEVEAQILAFVEGSELGIQKALGGFHKKLEDLEHDVAVVKRAVHDSLQSVSSAFETLEDPPATSHGNGGGGGWSSWIPGRAPSPTPTAGAAAAATFGNIMTNRHRTPIWRAVSALGLADSNNHHHAEEGRGGGGDIIKNLNLRIPMPDLNFVLPPSSSSLSPPHYQDSSSTLSGISTGGFGLGLGVGGGGPVPRPRTVSTMYMLGMGMGGRNPVVSSPLQRRRIVSAVPRFGDASAAAKMNENGKEQPQEVDVD